MEICKFYLLECCAKRDKCTYLHHEYPCKYYYLGMKCPEGRDCKFDHGKPLTNEFRAILLKHLETAPKEILGDFPRMPREKAIKLMDTAHLQLLRQERGEPAVVVDTSKIPSLLDGIVPKPKDKPKRSRWEDKVPPAPTLPDTEPEQNEIPEHLHVRNTKGILSDKQIFDLQAMGIESVEQIKQLTLMQVTQLGITMAQIQEIEVNSQKLLNKTTEPDEMQTQETSTTEAPNQEQPLDKPTFEVVNDFPAQDLDLRISLPIPSTITTTSTETLASTVLSSIDNPSQDIDLRLLSAVPPSLTSLSITSSSVITSTIESAAPIETPSYASFPNPSLVDYSQYLKDSHVKDDLDDHKDELQIAEDPPSAVEDEPELLIDENYYDDTDEEKEKEQKTEKEIDKIADDTLTTPINTQESLIASLKKLEKERIEVEKTQSLSIFTLSAPVYTQGASNALFSSFYAKQQEPEMKAPEILKVPEVPKTAEKRRLSINEIKSPSIDGSGDESPLRRPSIYDKPSDEEINFEDTPINKGDRDLRMPPMLLDSTDLNGSGDIDLRLPFKPMPAPYKPADEIDASITSHAPIPFKVNIDFKTITFLTLY